MVEIKAREGYYLSDPNKEHFYTAISGADVSADDYIEVPIEEADTTLQGNIDKKLSIETYNADKQTFATKDEIGAINDVLDNINGEVI